jgi:putative oligomerization/nucleic acid binding protein
VLYCGIGLIAAGFAVIVFREIAGGIVIDQLVVTDSAKPAGEATWAIATSLMTSIASTVIVVGVLFAIAGWLASPTGSARATRRAFAPVLRHHVAYVYAGLAIIVCLYFLSGPTQGLRTFLTTLVVAGMAAFGIHELRKQTQEEYPDADYSDVFGDTRDKVVSAVKDANIGERVGEQTSKLRLPEVKRPGGGAAASEAPTAVAPLNQEDARLERLERLASLRDKGVLTDEEFAAEKARLLGGDTPAS